MSDGVVNVAYQNNFVGQMIGQGPSCGRRHDRIIAGYTLPTATPAPGFSHSCEHSQALQCACDPAHVSIHYPNDCANSDCVSFDSIVEQGSAGWAFSPGITASSFAVRHWKLMEEGSAFEATSSRCEKDVCPAEPFREFCRLLDEDGEHDCTFVSKPDAPHGIFYTGVNNFTTECIDWFIGLPADP